MVAGIREGKTVVQLWVGQEGEKRLQVTVICRR